MKIIDIWQYIWRHWQYSGGGTPATAASSSDFLAYLPSDGEFVVQVQNSMLVVHLPSERKGAITPSRSEGWNICLSMKVLDLKHEN